MHYDNQTPEAGTVNDAVPCTGLATIQTISKERAQSLRRLREITNTCTHGDMQVNSYKRWTTNIKKINR